MRKKKKETRRELIGRLPATVGVPKFFSPADIQNLLRLRRINPHLSWDKAIDRVVFQSVPSLKTVLTGT